MNRKINCLVLVWIMAVGGCQQGHTGVEKVSVQDHADALAGQVRLIQEQTLELMAQHKWLKHRLEKCIEKLEAERGLEPIPFDWSKKMEIDYLPWKRDPKYAPPPELWFVPYESPNTPAWPVDKQHDIRTLIALLRLQSTTLGMYMVSTHDRIENFEKRLKRLESNLEK